MSKNIDAWYISSDNHVYLVGVSKDIPVSKITSDSGTATVYAKAHGLSIDAVVRISGCLQSAYNGDQTVVSVSTDSFTYAVSGSPVSPATPIPGKVIRCDAYRSDATITAIIRDSSGGTPANAATIDFDYKTASNGVYVGNLAHGVTLVEDAVYVVTVTATAGTGEVLTERLVGPAKYYGG